jgi:hypothetical protein
MLNGLLISCVGNFFHATNNQINIQEMRNDGSIQNNPATAEDREEK